MEFDINTNEGKYDLSAGVRLIGEDIVVSIWGGQKPHIGAVAAAQPRPSLADSNVISASVSVICFLGHKDDNLAKKTAETLAAAFNAKVVVTVGIHWDGLSQADISVINKNGEMLVDSVLRKIKSEFGKEK